MGAANHRPQGEAGTAEAAVAVGDAAAVVVVAVPKGERPPSLSSETPGHRHAQYQPLAPIPNEELGHHCHGR